MTEPPLKIPNIILRDIPVEIKNILTDEQAKEKKEKRNVAVFVIIHNYQDYPGVELKV